MAQPITASRLDRRIDIERKTVALDEFGDQSETWAKVATKISASVTPVRGDEIFAASQFMGKRVLEFRVRPSPFKGIQPPSVLDRIVYPPFSSDVSPVPQPPDYQVFDIQDVRELGRGKGWQMFAVARSETQEFEFPAEGEDDEDEGEESEFLNVTLAAFSGAESDTPGFVDVTYNLSGDWTYEDSGVLFVLTTNGSPPTHEQMFSGNDANDDAATWADSNTVSETNPQSFVLGNGELPPGTYYIHAYYWVGSPENTSGNVGPVISSSSFVLVGPQPLTISGTFTAGTAGSFVGYNQDPWVTSHDWDTGSAYGTPPTDPNPALVIVDSSGQCLVVLEGSDYKFPGGINLTVTGPGVNDTQYLDFWAGQQVNESWHGYGYVYGLNSEPMGFQSGETYNFMIEEVAEE